MPYESSVPSEPNEPRSENRELQNALNEGLAIKADPLIKELDSKEYLSKFNKTRLKKLINRYDNIRISLADQEFPKNLQSELVQELMEISQRLSVAMENKNLTDQAIDDIILRLEKLEKAYSIPELPAEGSLE